MVPNEALGSGVVPRIVVVLVGSAVPWGLMLTLTVLRIYEALVPMYQMYSREPIGGTLEIAKALITEDFVAAVGAVVGRTIFSLPSFYLP